MPEGRPSEDPYPRFVGRVVIGLLSLVAIVLAGAALKATAVLTMPLAFAFFLALLIDPVRAWVNDRLPSGFSWVGITTAMMMLILLVVGLGLAFWLAIETTLDNLPPYMARINAMREHLVELVNGNAAALMPDDENGLSAWVPLLPKDVGQLVTLVLDMTQAIPGTLVLIFFFVLLMLQERGNWRRKMVTLAGDNRHAMHGTLADIAEKVRQYLLVRATLSALSGLVAATWLWLAEVDFFYLWGLLTFLLNFVPNIGSIISVLAASLFAVLQYNAGHAFAVFIGLTAFEQILGNYVDPRMQGRRLDISPLMVLASVLAWGWVWGVPGALLAVPMTVTILIVCAHIEPLRPVAMFLSRTGRIRLGSMPTEDR